MKVLLVVFKESQKLNRARGVTLFGEKPNLVSLETNARGTLTQHELASWDLEPGGKSSTVFPQPKG